MPPSEFYSNGKYDYSIFEGKNGLVRTSNEQANYLAELCKKYQLFLSKMEWMKMIGRDGST